MSPVALADDVETGSEHLSYDDAFTPADDERRGNALVTLLRLEHCLNPDRFDWDDPCRLNSLPSGLGLTAPTAVSSPSPTELLDYARRIAVRRIQFGVSLVLECWRLTKRCRAPFTRPAELAPSEPDSIPSQTPEDQRIIRDCIIPLYWPTVRELRRAARTLRTGVSTADPLRGGPRFAAALGPRTFGDAWWVLQLIIILWGELARLTPTSNLLWNAVEEVRLIARRIPRCGWEAIHNGKRFELMGFVQPTAHQAVRQLAGQVADYLQWAAERAWAVRGVQADQVPFTLAWMDEAKVHAAGMFPANFLADIRRWEVELEFESARWRSLPVVHEQRFRVSQLEGAVYLDGESVARQLPPDVTAYLAAVSASCTEERFVPVTWEEICQWPGMKGKNQSRVRGRLPAALRELVCADASGHYIRLPRRRK